MPNPIEGARRARHASVVAQSRRLNDALTALDAKTEEVRLHAENLTKNNAKLIGRSEDLDRQIALISRLGSVARHGKNSLSRIRSVRHHRTRTAKHRQTKSLGQAVPLSVVQSIMPSNKLRVVLQDGVRLQSRLFSFSITISWLSCISPLPRLAAVCGRFHVVPYSSSQHCPISA
jgi:hypothetical protein